MLGYLAFTCGGEAVGAVGRHVVARGALQDGDVTLAASSAPPRSSAAILAWPAKSEPMKPMKSLQAVPLTVRSMVRTGMCLALAWFSAGARPVEFSGATMSTFAPWAIMFWMSVFCCATFALALRWMSLMPSALACVGDRLGLGVTERVARGLGLREPHGDVGLEVELRGAVLGERAAGGPVATGGADWICWAAAVPSAGRRTARARRLPLRCALGCSRSSRAMATSAHGADAHRDATPRRVGEHPWSLLNESMVRRPHRVATSVVR